MNIVRLKKYMDERGSLVENTLLSVMSTSEHFFISKSKPGVVRGNHYHKHKMEWFYIIQGTCKLVVKDIISEKIEELIIKDSDNILVNTVPNHAHAFQNVGENEMILLALVNEPLDQKNPDTYFYKLL